MSDRGESLVMATEDLDDTEARILQECKQRHPAWIGRMETSDYYPIAQIRVHELHSGDIIDVREFRVHIEEANAFMVVGHIECDGEGVLGIDGKLPDGRDLLIRRPDGLPIRRRRVVRFGRRTNI
jgi:hypothetical protein